MFFKRILTLLFVAVLCAATNNMFADNQQLAFPGADGYGKYVTGGRGGEVCYVTRLDDCSDTNLVPGTLRWALRHDNGGRPRTVLFATSGTIYLTSKLKLQYPDVSILGQSAPGGGICISGYNMYICKNNVIVRYIRFRAGDIPNASMTGLDIENCKGVILDHCSMTWSMEECLTAYDTDNTTVQWCIIGEGLYSSKNAKGARAYAMQWGGEHSTMHHTLVTNSHSRSPRFNGVRSKSNNKGDHDYQVDSEFANNVVFNWSSTGAIYGGEYDRAAVEVAGTWTDTDKGYNRVYLINNYYKPGPSTKAGNTQPHFASPSSPCGQWYLNGNKFEETGTYAPWTAAAAQAANNNNNQAVNGLLSSYILNEIPYALSGLQYETSAQAYSNVITKAGASLPRYDEVDRRLLDEAAGKVAPKFVGATLKGNNDLGIIDSPDDIVLQNPGVYYANGVAYHNYPSLALKQGEKYMVDDDCDGMPNAYEDAMGFNKDDAADGAAVASNGYTNLENYLNGIAEGTINKAQYETENVMFVPGVKELPSSIIVTYSNTDASVKGTLPEKLVLGYGESVTIPENTTLYKEGYTLVAWTGNGYYLGAGNVVTPCSKLTLTPVFTANKASIAARTAPVVAVWKNVDASSSLVVTRAEVNGESIDVAINPSNGSIYGYNGEVEVNHNGNDIIAVFPFMKTVEGVSGSGTATATWTWGGTPDANGVITPVASEGAFASVKATVNANGLATGSKSVSGKPCVALTPTKQESGFSTSSVAYMQFTITPMNGMKFKATSISWNGAFCGTGGGNYAVTAQTGNGSFLVQKSGLAPSRDALAPYSVNLTSQNLSSDPVKLRIYVYNLATTKQGVIRDVVITGEYEGTAEPPVTYTFTVNPYTEGTGTVAISPVADTYTEGKSVTLTATPAEGYLFDRWMQADGTTISTEATTTLTATKDYVVFAEFKSEADYAHIFDSEVYDAEVSNKNELAIALDAARNRSNQNVRYRIFLHNGVYDFGSKAKTVVPQNTSLIGESQDGVVILNSPVGAANYQEDTPVLFIDQNQNNVYMQDLTIRQARDWQSKKSAGQALALRQRGKMAAYKNVTLQGIQDTYYINKADASAYFETSTLAGEVDFIYGDGTVWFEKCNLHPVSSGAVITASNAQTGYNGFVFNDCVIEPEPSSSATVAGYALGRPWGDSPAATYLNTTMKVLPLDAGWKGMTSGLVLRFHEYGSKDASGTALDLSKRSLVACGAAAGSDSPVITAEQAAAYTIKSVFERWSWNPQTLTMQLTAPLPKYDATIHQLFWEPVDGALGYAVCVGGTVKAITKNHYCNIEGDDLTIRVINAMGGMGTQSPVAVPGTSGIEHIVANSADKGYAYNLAGQRVTSATKGIVIVRGKKAIMR